MKKTVNAACNECYAEVTVEYDDEGEVVAFCPICSAQYPELDEEEEEELDEDE